MLTVIRVSGEMGAGDNGGGAVELAKTIMLPYLQRADELQKHDPLVAYYCRLYSMERGLKVPAKERSKTMNALLLSLMNQLEKDKKSVKLSPDDNLHVEGFALSVFAKADKQDRAGRADINTAKTFYASSIFFEILTQFGELQPEIEQKQKYAVWKAADIRKALSEGRKPEPGPPGGDSGFSLDDMVTEQELLSGETARSDPQIKSTSSSREQDASYHPSSASLPPAIDHSPASPPPPPPPTDTSYYQSSMPPDHFQRPPEHFQSQSSRWDQPRTHDYQDQPRTHDFQDQPRTHDQTHDFQDQPRTHDQTHDFQDQTHDYQVDGASFSSTYPSTNFYPSSSSFSQHQYQQDPGTAAAAGYHSPPSYPCFPPTYNSHTSPAMDPSSYQAPALQQQYPSAPAYEAPPPLARSTSAPPKPELEKIYAPPPEKISEAHKASRFAVSALAFDDVPTAISYLRRSLELLTSPSAS